MTYLELAKSVVEHATTGANEVEVFITSSQETRISISRGEVEQLLQSINVGMGVRVLQDGKTGYAYTSDLSADGVEQTWRAAQELAQIATPDPFRVLPEPQPIVYEDLGIWDADLAHIPMERKIALVQAVEQSALNYDPRIVLSNWCTYEDDISQSYLANSKGFAGEYGRTTAASYLMAIARDSDGKMTDAFGVGASNSFSGLDAQTIGTEAAQKALGILGGKPVPKQVGTVILDHFVGGQIMAAIAQALSGEAWQKQRSFLMGKMGKSIANDIVTLMDHGRLPHGMASAPFDGEGLPTKATRLVDEGVLQNLIYDSYSANKAGAGAISTGNAQRFGYRSVPMLAPSNFYMQPGHISRDEIIAGVERGLYVISVMQTGGINPITGDCSMGASGLWIENGKITHAVGGVTIATTLPELLMNITQVGSDLRFMPFFGALGVPTLRVDNVMIGGV